MFKLRSISSLVIGIAATFLFAACSDWTKSESIQVKTPTIDGEHPELYKQYLQNLREYRKTDHKLVLGWFDNSDKNPQSRGGRLVSLPDSLDIVSLMYGSDLSEKEMADIRTVRNDKGMKVIYTIDYDAYETQIALQNEEAVRQAEEESEQTGETVEPELIELLDVLPGFIDSQLALLTRYEYDGVSINYSGQYYYYMTAEQLARQTEIQSIIFSRLETVRQANEGKLYIFEGKPENIIDAAIMDDFDYIVLRTENVSSISGMLAAINVLGSNPLIPKDRLILSVRPVSEAVKDSGILLDAMGVAQNAIVETAHWMNTPSEYEKAGLGIYFINDDYYNVDLDYRYTREAISIMNP